LAISTFTVLISTFTVFLHFAFSGQARPENQWISVQWNKKKCSGLAISGAHLCFSLTSGSLKSEEGRLPAGTTQNVSNMGLKVRSKQHQDYTNIMLLAF